MVLAKSSLFLTVNHRRSQVLARVSLHKIGHTLHHRPPAEMIRRLPHLPRLHEVYVYPVHPIPNDVLEA